MHEAFVATSKWASLQSALSAKAPILLIFCGQITGFGGTWPRICLLQSPLDVLCGLGDGELDNCSRAMESLRFNKGFETTLVVCRLCVGHNRSLFHPSSLLLIFSREKEGQESNIKLLDLERQLAILAIESMYSCVSSLKYVILAPFILALASLSLSKFDWDSI